MPARILDGEAYASQIHRETASRVAALTKRGVTPRLVFIRVGEDPASRAYVSRKESRAKEVAAPRANRSETAVARAIQRTRGDWLMVDRPTIARAMMMMITMTTIAMLSAPYDTHVHC